MISPKSLIYFLVWAFVASSVSGDVRVENSPNNSIVCGNARKVLNDCFNNLPPEVLKFLSISKIPITKAEIDGKCDVFQQGMRCVDDYTRKCIEEEKRKVLESTVFGAKSFLKRLCHDSRFQADYLRHKDCFLYIEDDWQRCSSQFLTILTEELHSADNKSKNISTKFMQFCCDRIKKESEHESESKTATFTRNINSAFGPDAVSERTTQWWLEKFRSGDMDLGNELREQPGQSIDKDELRALVESQPHQTIRDLAEKLGVHNSKVRRHFQQLGKVKTLDEWVPHELSEQNMTCRMEISSFLSRTTVQKLNELCYETLPYPLYSPEL